MISLKERTLEELEGVLANRGRKFAFILEKEERDIIIRDAIRKLNSIVNSPRTKLIQSPAKKMEMTEDVDEVCRVLFSNDFWDNMVRDIGIIPYISKSQPMLTIESISEFLVLKGNLNMMSRHMKTAPDWEYNAPILEINQNYTAIQIDFLPYLNPDNDSWYLFEHEKTFIVDYGWALLNKRNAEALVSATFLGIGTEYKEVLSYWSTELDKVESSFLSAGVITYLN